MAELHFYDDIVTSVSKEGVKIDGDILKEQTFTILDYIKEHPHEDISLYGSALSIALALELGVRIAEEEIKDKASLYVAQRIKTIREDWCGQAQKEVGRADDILTLVQLAEAIVTAVLQEGAEAE